MFALLLSLLLTFAVPDSAIVSSDQCARLFEAAERPASRSDRAGWQQYLHQLQEARRCYGDRSTERLMHIYIEETLAYHRLNRPGKIRQTIDTFFERFAAAPDSSLFSDMYQLEAWIYFERGNFGEAASSFSRTLAYAQVDPPSERALLLRDVANFFQRIKDFDTARQYFQRAKEVLRAVDPSMHKHPETWARIIADEADFSIASIRYTAPNLHPIFQTALQKAQQALDLIPEGKLVGKRVHAYVLIGEICGVLGNIDQGRRALEEALQLARSHHLSGWHYWTLFKLGRFHIMAGDLDAAERAFTDALHRAQDARERDHVRRLYANFGLLYAKAGDPARAAAYYRKSNRVLEEQRATLRTTDWSATSFNVWAWTYRALVRNLFLQGRYEEAFQTFAQMRARYLHDLRTQMRLTRTLPPAQRTRYDSLTTALVAVRDRLAQGTLSPAERSHLTSRETQLVAARSDLVDLDTTRIHLPLDTLQQQLRRRDQTLVAYFLDRGSPVVRRPTQSFAFVVTPDTLRAVPLDDTQVEYRRLLAEASPLLADSTDAASLNATHFDLGALHRFYQKLYAPLAPYVPDDARLVVIPDGPLFQLPMSMFVTEPAGRFAYAGASYLAEHHPISYELSPTLLLDHDAPLPPTNTDLVAFGRSDFGGAAPEGWSGLRLRAAVPNPSAPLTDLPGVAAEFDRLDDLFAHRRLLLDDQATEAAFYADSNRAQIVHLASHALVQPNSPLRSAFVLAPDSANDGILYLHELMSRAHPIPLVVLSACGTAQGAFYDGEGLQGLQYAFRATGTKSTLSTLWPIDDDAAVSITTAFYHYLQEDLPKDVALQHAQRDYLTAGDHPASPFYWAAPVLYGSPRPLDLAKPSSIPVLPVAAGGVVLLLLGLGFAYARSRRTPSRHG